MSIAEKQVLLRSFQERLNESLPASVVAGITDSLISVLDSFDVVQHVNVGSDVQTSDCLQAFLEAKTLEGRSPKTIARYKYVIERMHNDTGVAIRDVTVFHLRSWLTKMRQAGVSDTTIEGFRCVMSSYFGWLYKEGFLPSNPCGNLGPVKCQKKERFPYSGADIARLKAACSTPRDKAIIAILLSTGCRISEICDLNREDINLDKLECTVLGKGNKERVVYFDDETAMFLQQYLDSRSDDYEALFVGRGSSRMTPGGVRKRLNIISEQARVENVHPHRFRRTLATNLISRGMPIQMVASIMGHEKLDTTMVYIHSDKTDIRNGYRKYAG